MTTPQALRKHAAETPADRTAYVRALLDMHLPEGIGVSGGDGTSQGTGELVELRDPATGALLTSWQDPGEPGADRALGLASAGFNAWRGLGPAGRAAMLRRAGAAMRAQAAELAELETATTGKPIRDTTAELGAIGQMFDVYAGWAERINGETLNVGDRWHAYTRLEPFGLVVVVAPWNAPLLTACANALPALAAGNSVVVKPSEFTPVSAVRLANLFVEAGAPPGVLTAAPGLGHTMGTALTTAPQAGKIVFIGSVPTGREVAAAAARSGTPTILELGGKSANIVFDDADLDAASDGALSAIFSGAGQSCQAGSRLLVHERVRDDLVRRIRSGARLLRVGDPLDPATELGPIIHARQYDRIGALIELGRGHGARLLDEFPLPAPLTGSPFTDGLWVMPTLLDGVHEQNPLNHTEVFGPVLSIDTFADESEALVRANGTEFGLAGAVWTSDVARAHRFAAAVEAGTLYVNCYKVGHPLAPFGGFRASGWGRASGRGVVEEFVQSKMVWVPTGTLPAPFPSLAGRSMGGGG